MYEYVLPVNKMKPSRFGRKMTSFWKVERYRSVKQASIEENIFSPGYLSRLKGSCCITCVPLAFRRTEPKFWKLQKGGGLIWEKKLGWGTRKGEISEKRGETQLFKLNSGKEKDKKLAASANDAVHFAYHAQIVVKSVFTMIFIYGDRGGQGHLILKNYGGGAETFTELRYSILFKSYCFLSSALW